ncbi:hypothetical protein D3C86_1963330 [compost metagenome]
MQSTKAYVKRRQSCANLLVAFEQRGIRICKLLRAGCRLGQTGFDLTGTGRAALNAALNPGEAASKRNNPLLKFRRSFRQLRTAGYCLLELRLIVTQLLACFR